MDTQERFGPVAIALHWFVAVIIVCAVVLAWIVEDLDRGATKDLVLTIHKSVGLTIFALTVFRLTWRMTHPAPPLPPEMRMPMRVAAWLTHATLYAIVFGMSVTGYLSVAARGRETTFFGIFEVPRLGPLDRAFSRSMEQVHGYGQYVLYALVLAHVGAALYHRFALKDRVLARMWPFGASA